MLLHNAENKDSLGLIYKSLSQIEQQRTKMLTKELLTKF